MALRGRSSSWVAWCSTASCWLPWVLPWPSAFRCCAAGRGVRRCGGRHAVGLGRVGRAGGGVADRSARSHSVKRYGARPGRHEPTRRGEIHTDIAISPAAPATDGCCTGSRGARRSLANLDLDDLVRFTARLVRSVARFAACCRAVSSPLHRMRNPAPPSATWHGAPLQDTGAEYLTLSSACQAPKRNRVPSERTEPVVSA